MPRLRPQTQDHRAENGQHRIRLWMGEQEPQFAYQVELLYPLGPELGGEIVVFEVIWPPRAAPSQAVTLPHDATFTFLDMAPRSGLTTSPMTGPLPDTISGSGAEFWAGIVGAPDDDDAGVG
jgi:hypothetical protein